MDPTLTGAAIVTVVASIGGTIVMIINAVSSARDRREASAERKLQLTLLGDTSKKADTLINATSEIHTLTNATNSNLQKALEVMTEKMMGLQKLLDQAERTRLVTAAVQAEADRHAPPPAAPPPADETLKAIETNTAATVDALKESKA